MGLLESLAKRIAHRAVVTHKQAIARNAVHLVLQGEDWNGLSYTPGEHLRVLVGLDQPGPLGDKVRTYSVWNYDAARQRMDVVVCLHSDGPGARWGQRVAVSDAVHFTGPKGKFTVDSTGDFYLFVGDDSALAHLYELRRHVPAGKPVFGVVYAPSESDFFPDLDGTRPLSFRVLPENPVEDLLEQVRPVLQSAAGSGRVYIGGDGRTCVALNRYFRAELGWKTHQIKTKPFWQPGKVGLE